MKIGIIGVGAYSNAMTLQLYKNNKDITMWTESDKVMTNYLKDGCVKNVIPGVELPKDIRVTRSYEEVAEDKDIIFILSAAAYVGSVCDELN